MAGGAFGRGHILSHPFAVRIRAGLFEVALKEFQDTLKTESFFAAAGTARGLSSRSLAIGRGETVKQQVLYPCGILLERSIEVEAIGISGEFQRALENRRTGARAQ